MSSRPSTASPRRPLHSRTHTRDRSFSIEQFTDLISTALDLHRVPDNQLSFSPPLTASQRIHSPPKRARRALKKFRSAFFRKEDQEHAPQPLHAQPQRSSFNASRLASSSTPALSLPPLPLESGSQSTLELDLRFGSLTDPPTPAESAFVITPNIAHAQLNIDRTSDDDVNVTQGTSDRSSDTNVKPQYVLRRAPKQLMRPSSPSSSVYPEQLESISTRDASKSFDTSKMDADGMRSFFDDSGFAEAENLFPKVSKKSSKSLLNIRNIFSKSPDPVLLANAATSQRSVNPLSPALASPADPFPEERVTSCGLSEEECVPTIYAHVNADAHVSAHGAANEISSRSGQTSDPSLSTKGKKARRHPPIYPVPTCPLPPIPVASLNDSAIHLDELFEPDSNDASQSSINTAEIESWRMPMLELSTSITSSGSSSQAHAQGRPSRSSIQERFGLGPRLLVNAPLPEDGELNQDPRSAPAMPSSRATFRNKFPRELSIEPPPRASRLQLSKIASTSLVSLRSIATITKTSSAPDEDREQDVSRAFTFEDDPFAADPPTPITPLFYGEEGAASPRLLTTLSNDSSPSLPSPLTPVSAPPTAPSWHYRLGNKSSPVLPSNSPSMPMTEKTFLLDRLAPSLGRRRHQHQSQPSQPPSSCRNFNHVLERVRKISSSQSSVSSSTGSSDTTRAPTHTTSRPNSPFPLLFLRSRSTHAKTSPVETEFKRPFPVPSTITRTSGQGVGLGIAIQQNSTKATQLLKHGTVPLLSRPVRAPRKVKTPETNCRNLELEQARRDIVSPTAWLLDSDDYDTESVDYKNEKRMAARSLGIDLQRGRPSSSKSASQDPVPPYVEVENERDQDPSRRLSDVEDVMQPAQSWPMPPQQTFTVSVKETGSHHVVEPKIEVDPPGSLVATPRHSIQISERMYPSPSSNLTSPVSFDSRRSSNSSSSKRLSTQQAKAILIAKAMELECNIEQNQNDIGAGGVRHRADKDNQKPALGPPPLESPISSRSHTHPTSSPVSASGYYTPPQSSSPRSTRSDQSMSMSMSMKEGLYPFPALGHGHSEA